MLFMGRDVTYWIELQGRCESLGSADMFEDVVSLVKENRRLRGRIAYYESKIDQMILIRKEDII